MPFSSEAGDRSAVRTIRIDGTTFEIIYQKGKAAPVRTTAELNDCCWYEGFVNNDSIFFWRRYWQLCYTQRALIIYVPQTGYSYACGLEQDAREMCLKLLTNSPALKLRQRRRVEPILVLLGSAIGIMLSSSLFEVVIFPLVGVWPRIFLEYLSFYTICLPIFFAFVGSCIAGNDRMLVHWDATFKYILYMLLLAPFLLYLKTRCM